MKLTYTSDSGAEYWTIAIWAEGSRLAGRERELKQGETYDVIKAACPWVEADVSPLIARRMNFDHTVYTGTFQDIFALVASVPEGAPDDKNYEWRKRMTIFAALAEQGFDLAEAEANWKEAHTHEYIR